MDLILLHPTYEFKNFPPIETCSEDLNNFRWISVSLSSTDACYWEVKISIIGAVVLYLSLDEIKEWLIKLHQHNFYFNSEHSPLFLILVKRFIKTETPTTPKGLLDIIDFLLEISYPVYSQDINFTNYSFNTLRTLLQVPDCIWFSAAFGNIDCIKKFLPYWKQHPLTILLLLYPWSEKIFYEDTMEKLMLNSIETILPILIELGGPLSHGTNLYSIFKRYILKWKCEGNCKETDQEGLNPDRKNASYLRILRTIQNLHNSPASLKVLCRTIIRENVSGHETDLPNYLSSLVPDKLKTFLSLKQLIYRQFNILQHNDRNIKFYDLIHKKFD